MTKIMTAAEVNARAIQQKRQLGKRYLCLQVSLLSPLVQAAADIAENKKVD